MDLSFIQQQLDTFATFAGAIDDFLLKPIEIIGRLGAWFGDADGNGKIGVVEAFNATSSIFKK